MLLNLYVLTFSVVLPACLLASSMNQDVSDSDDDPGFDSLEQNIVLHRSGVHRGRNDAESPPGFVGDTDDWSGEDAYDYDSKPLFAYCGETILGHLQNLSDKDIRLQPEMPADIDIKVVVLSLDDVSDVRGVVTLVTRLELRWYDSRLNTSVAECSQSEVMIPTKNIWFPLFVVQNSASNIVYADAWNEVPSIVRGDGYVQWRIALRTELSCDTDLSLFPFDTQYCLILLQSPHFAPFTLKYSVKDKRRGLVLLNSKQSNPTFSITGQNIRYTRKVPGIQIWYSLERHAAYYVWSIIIPTVSIAFTTGCAFVVPGAGDDKVTIAITGFLGYLFLYGVIVSSLPHASRHTPYLLPFIAFNILSSVVVVVMASIIVRLRTTEIFKLHVVVGNKAEKAMFGSKISAKVLNEVCMIVYFGVVILMYIAFVSFIFVKYQLQEPPLSFTKIEEYTIGE